MTSLSLSHATFPDREGLLSLNQTHQNLTHLDFHGPATLLIGFPKSIEELFGKRKKQRSNYGDFAPQNCLKAKFVLTRRELK
jgi:hypothetical protein